MINPNTFHKEYLVGKKKFILTKTEIRLEDAGKPGNHFRVLLEELTPFHEYGIHINPIWLIGLCYLFTGIVIKLTEIYFNKVDLGQIALLPLFLFVIVFPIMLYDGYRIYRRSSAVKFYYHANGNLAFTLPIDKKNKTKTEEFMQILIQRIRESIPNNEAMLAMIYRYGVLTRSEAIEIDASISQHTVNLAENENIIRLGSVNDE